MRKIISFFILIFNLAIVEQLYAQVQSACPFIDAGPDTSVHCGSCVTLNAVAVATQQSTSYTVSPITYAPPFPFNFGTPILVNIDDHWSGVQNLPFTFCYFGNAYNSLIVGSNGVVSFNTANAGLYNTYPITAPIPSTTPADLLNSIMGPWHDIDPSVSGQMYYQVAGFAPCRMIVFSWDNVAMFSTTCNNLLASQQIVLYENSNIIDIYIGNCPVCPSWNSGAAIEGIQNSTGTTAYVVPGRNYPTQWTASNDAWRFTPDGAPNYSISWLNSTGVIGTGNSITVCPDSTTDYVAVATYALCGAASASVYDSIRVSIEYPTDSLTPDTLICIGQNIQLSAFPSGGSGNYTYQWSNGATQQSQFVSPTVNTTYSVIAYDDSGCASIPRSVTVSVNPPLSLAISPSATICQGDTTGIYINGSGGNGGPYFTTWSNGAADVDSINVTPLTNMVYSVIFRDGCGTPPDTAQELVKVNKTPVVDFSPRFSQGCQPLDVQFTDATTNNTLNSTYTWNFGDGATDYTEQNPLHRYLSSGKFDVALRVKTREGCESADTIRNAVLVEPKPVSLFVPNPQETSILFPNVWFNDRSLSAVAWSWDFGDRTGTSVEQNPSYTYREAGNYNVQLIVTSSKGCLDTLNEMVIVDDDFTLYIPKAFTPNGDGVNDNFQPMGYGIRKFSMDIFDRWGELVFHTDDVNDTWNGKMRGTGKPCDHDVYVYKVTATDNHDVTHDFVGRVNLIY